MKEHTEPVQSPQTEPLLKRVAGYIEQHNLLPERGTIIVAVSGGADSLCLLHMLRTFYYLPDATMPEHVSIPVSHSMSHPKPTSTIQLHVAHLNHQLRGEQGERDAEQVAQLARSWGLPVTIGSVDVPALARREHRSLEDAARTARYRFLRDVAQGNLIAVAHHQDDQVETLLLHWLRGGGIHSMIGLQPRQQDILRPLLCLTHAETLAYCQEHGLLPIEDASNSDTRFVRNRIRHELLPLLEQMNPGFRATLLRSSEVMSVDAAWLDEQVEQVWPTLAIVAPECIRLSIQALNGLPLSLQRHTVRHATSLLNAGQSPLELRHYELIEELLQRPHSIRSVVVHLPASLLVRREGDVLLFEYRTSSESGESGEAAEQWENATNATFKETYLPIPGSVHVPGTSWTASAEPVPGDVANAIYEALQSEQWEHVFHVLPADAYNVYVDADRVAEYNKDTDETQQGNESAGLWVRLRRPGDRMQALGMSHEKKVQDIFIDRHIPRRDRDTYPLFLAGEHLIWLGGITIDERVKLRRETKRILRLRLY